MFDSWGRPSRLRVTSTPSAHRPHGVQGPFEFHGLGQPGTGPAAFRVALNPSLSVTTLEKIDSGALRPIGPSMPLPDLFVVGAPKAGTTALHAALAGHPALHMSPVKEPKFYLCDERPPPEAGRARRQPQPARVGVAPRPLRGAVRARPAGHAQGREHALLPVEPGRAAPHRPGPTRARSSWPSSATRWTAPTRTGPTSGPTASSRSATSSRPASLEPERVGAGWAPFWRYRGLGRYGEQIEHLLTLFPNDQVHVLRYRDLVEDPADTLDPHRRSSSSIDPEGFPPARCRAENVSTWVEPTPVNQVLRRGRAHRGVDRASSPRPSRGAPPAGRC